MNDLEVGQEVWWFDLWHGSVKTWTKLESGKLLLIQKDDECRVNPPHYRDSKRFQKIHRSLVFPTKADALNHLSTLCKERAMALEAEALEFRELSLRHASDA